jgi:Ni,Fe-hydrogenase III large subunit
MSTDRDVPEAPLALLLGQSEPVAAHRPWPRHRVSDETWKRASDALGSGELTLLALWGDTDAVHLALLDEARAEIAVVTRESPDGRYPSIAASCPAAARLERAIRDLWGLEAEGAEDDRPWLDHGRWGTRAPLASGHAPRAAAARLPAGTAELSGGDSGAAGYPFLTAEGDGLHQIPVGPVHAGIIEPGHFRFTANGEAVVRLEERLGYVHKGVESLMAGASLSDAAHLAGHVSGDSTVAYALAFARAVEAALGWEVPARAVWLRALLAELERLANHMGDIGAICNDAAFTIVHANCAMLREQIIRANEACFGHRLLMDRVVPGGMAVDLGTDGARALRDLVRLVRPRFDELVDVYDNSPSMLERAVGTGILRPSLARSFGCGGYVGRASLRAFDARRSVGYPPYGELTFDVPVLNSGDVNARVWVRIKEVQESLRLVEQILDRMPEGEVRGAVTPKLPTAAEGAALVEGFRGDVFAWIRIGATGDVERCHLRDPSWFQWPLLEAAIEGNIVADFPLCNKSFNCSYSGHDL